MTMLMMMWQWWDVGGQELGEDGVLIYSRLIDEVPTEQILRFVGIIT